MDMRKSILGFVLILGSATLVACGAIVDATEIDWSTTPSEHRGKNGELFTYDCPAGGSAASTIWGTDTYTDDSSICVAAVHAGQISTAVGGLVTIEIAPGLTSYAGSTRNGVTSQSYGEWSGSFVFR